MRSIYNKQFLKIFSCNNHSKAIKFGIHVPNHNIKALSSLQLSQTMNKTVMQVITYHLVGYIIVKCTKLLLT